MKLLTGNVPFCHSAIFLVCIITLLLACACSDEQDAASLIHAPVQQAAAAAPRVGSAEKMPDADSPDTQEAKKTAVNETEYTVDAATAEQISQIKRRDCRKKKAGAAPQLLSV
jgi:hypothetical protein